MKPLIEYFKHDAAYWGEQGHWLVADVTHRDSDTLARSNWQVMLERLGGESDTVQIERASCWLVGWRDYLVIDPVDTRSVKAAREMLDAIDRYPVLDEDHWSQLEDDERETCWKSFGRAAWQKWFVDQWEPVEDGEAILEEHKEASETFLNRAYHTYCMGYGSAGCEPSNDYTLERAVRDSECAWWCDDAAMCALMDEMGITMQKWGVSA